MEKGMKFDPSQAVDFHMWTRIVEEIRNGYMNGNSKFKLNFNKCIIENKNKGWYKIYINYMHHQARVSPYKDSV
jgi:hypothetical protein